MSHKEKIEQLLSRTLELARQQNKPAGFCIGNTAKINPSGLYFTPLRDTYRMVIGGVIVYSEQQAIDTVKIVDGRVDYILVDAEKKIPDSMSRSGQPANVERAVRETVNKSTLWSYKGNDLAVEALDNFLTYLTTDSISGIGGKKVAIIGAGNLGCKLAIKLVERGAHVFITRRDKEKALLFAEAINHIKPAYTTAKVTSAANNETAAKAAEILIGMTQGIQVITLDMVKSLAPGAIIIDGGKGTLWPEAVEAAEESGIEIYRLDVSAAFEGVISSLFAVEDMVKKRLGRGVFNGRPVVSGGLLGRHGDIVVDNVHKPEIVYGIADGKGDFIRNLSKVQIDYLAGARKEMQDRLNKIS